MFRNVRAFSIIPKFGVIKNVHFLVSEKLLLASLSQLGAPGSLFYTSIPLWYKIEKNLDEKLEGNEKDFPKNRNSAA